MLDTVLLKYELVGRLRQCFVTNDEKFHEIFGVKYFMKYFVKYF